MASLRRRLWDSMDQGHRRANLNIDYVIHFKVPPKERAEAEAGFCRLIQALADVGLTSQVRRGNGDSLLIFVRMASQNLFKQQVYRSRLQDWLHGVRVTGPETESPRASGAFGDEPVTEAERLRLVHDLITRPVNEGGAGVGEAGRDTSKYVASIFPLHDQAFNKAWIQKWSSKYVLDQADIDDIRNKYGEKVAFYFAFLRSYLRFLIFPSALGLGAWLLLGQFSHVYALGCGFWSVVFFEYWKQKEIDLAVQWGVRGVSSIQHQRPAFKWDFEAEDPVTGEPKKVYPFMKRFQTQLLQILFAFACVLVLGGLVVLCNSLEIFINEVYNGPFKQYLAFLPTVLLVVFTPTFSSVLMSAANALTERENYETTDAHNAAVIQKQFVLNFMTSYMALLFTAFVYIPFGESLIPLLDFWQIAAQTVTWSEKSLPTQSFRVNPQRISSQMFYFTVTAQIVNFATEVIVPYVTHKAVVKAKKLQSRGTVHAQDHADEADFLERVRNEAELETYDVTDDYREMVMQFGYLSLFSVAWPLAASCFLINNWVELRSDALKIAISCRRPTPWRSDSIGTWLTALGFLSWLGSVTSSATVYLCSNTRNGSGEVASRLTAWGGLLSVLVAEHFYLLVQLAVRHIMRKLESPGLQEERKERYLMKKRLLQENLGWDGTESMSRPAEKTMEDVSRETLEEEARQASIKGHGTAEEMFVVPSVAQSLGREAVLTLPGRFWQRQRGAEDTITIGRRLIEQGVSGDDKPKGSGPVASPRA